MSLTRPQPRSYRCIGCGAYWDRHWPTCARCFTGGQVIPWADRPRAAVDRVPGIANARTLARLAWEEVVQPAYPDLRLGARSLVEVFGPPGAGKSSWACRLADAVEGPALLVASEEGIGPSLAARLARCRVTRPNFTVLTRASVDTVAAHARRLKATSLVVDSVQESAYTASELRHLVEVVPSLMVLVAVLQVTKAGLPSGANSLQHEADAVVAVEAMSWRLTKSRFQALDTAGGPVLPSATKEAPHDA